VLRPGARRLGEYTKGLQEVYGAPATLVRKDREQPVHGPLGLLEAILAEGEKRSVAAALQGSGRDEPRPALGNHARPRGADAAAGRVDDLAEADDIFTKLMGDVVEPRREFIQQNALSVENLDT
jgi:DNA gyrase subunit B